MCGLSRDSLIQRFVWISCLPRENPLSLMNRIEWTEFFKSSSSAWNDFLATLFVVSFEFFGPNLQSENLAAKRNVVFSWVCVKNNNNIRIRIAFMFENCGNRLFLTYKDFFLSMTIWCCLFRSWIFKTVINENARVAAYLTARVRFGRQYGLLEVCGVGVACKCW